MRTLRVALAAAVGLWFCALAAGFLPDFARTAALDLGWSAVCFLAAAAALAGARGEYRRPFLFLGAGTLSWGAGQLAWTWYELVLGDVPYPSLADVGFTLSLPLLALGLLTWPRERAGFAHGERVDGLLLAGAVGLVSFVLVIEPIVERGFSASADWLLLAYPVGDVVMLGAATFGLAVQGFRDHGRMLVIALGLVALGVADTGFAIAGESYVTGTSYIDAGWTLGFAGIGAAALLPTGWGARLRLPRGATPVAVLAVLAIAVATQVLDEYREGAANDLVGEMLTGGLLLVLGFRHVHLSVSRLRESLRLVDLTRRLEHESALRTATRDRFLAEVVRAQELEARRIAELLHDDAVQQLTALGLRLELAAMRSGEQSLRDLASEAGAVTASIRRLLVDLHPAVLESRGIAAAVDGAAESLRAAGVEVAVAPLELRLVPEHEHLAYRLVQEALANALAHAEATRVEVSFAADDGTFRCSVVDDGRGFAADTVAEQSMGLHLVRERIDLAGGSFAIGAREHGGTSFSFELPLRPRETEAAA